MRRVSTEQQAHLEGEFEGQRTRLLDKINLKDYIDHPFIFLKRQALCAALTRIDLFRKIIGVQGSIVECGVHKGNSLMLYYHLSTIFEPYSFNRKIIGFDTFSGFRSVSPHDPKIDEPFCADTNYELLARMAEINDLNRPVSHIPKIELIKGDATVTIPKYKKDHPELIIALLYLDFDIYMPTKVALENLLSLVPRGGIVAFDELNSKKWAGETSALKKVLPLNKIKLRKFPYDPWPSYFVVGE